MVVGRRAPAILALAVLAPAAGGGSAGTAPPARAQGVDQTCVLALAKFDPATLNVAYPDDSAQYYVGAYARVPGTRIRIHGRFPHARYMSFNVYDPEQRPLDGLTDVRITPDPGSSNPFSTGADRTATRRDYTAFIDFGPKPARPAPNTLYTGTAQDGTPNLTGTFIYRIYIPDTGTGDTGGVGIPSATLEPATGTTNPAPGPCTNAAKPTLAGLNEQLAAVSPPADLPQQGGTNPPTWRKFVNLLSSITINAVGTPAPAGVDLDEAGGSGGFLSNKDNAYVSTPSTRSFGKVLVTRIKAPTFPDTRGGAKTMPGGQLRYWSLCQNDPPTQRMIACVNDDRAVIDAGGYATFVISTTAARPANATRGCGVNWMPWGADPKGVVLYRNMLPADGFTASVQGATVDRERATMGDYLPVSRYYADGRAYDSAAGCHPVTPSAAVVPCSSRRVVRLTLPAGRLTRTGRRVTVTAGGRSRSVRVQPGRHVSVDLRRLARGTFRVRVSAGGRTLARRTFRTCTPGPQRRP